MSQPLMTNPFERDHFYLTVGAAVKAARESAGVTQAQLAGMAKLTKSTMLNVEQGMTCSLLVAARIAEALDTTLDALVPLEALR